MDGCYIGLVIVLCFQAISFYSVIGTISVILVVV